MRWRRTCMNLQKPGNRYPEPLTARSYLKTPFKRHVTRFTFFSPFISIYLYLSSWFLSSFCGVQYSPVPFFPPLVAPGEDRAGLGARHAQGGEGRQRGCGGRSAAAAKQPWRWAGGVGPGDWNLGLGLGGWTLETWGSRLENFFFPPQNWWPTKHVGPSIVHTNIGCTAHWLGQLSRVSLNAIILEKPFQVVPLPLCLSQGCLLRMKSQRRCLWCLLRLKNQRRNQTWKCGNCRPKAAPPLLSVRKRWANQRASQTEIID